MFEALLEQYPLSPRSLYGKARALDILAEKKQSNDLLHEALSYYARVLNAPRVPDDLFIISAERYIDRARFMGECFKLNWVLSFICLLLQDSIRRPLRCIGKLSNDFRTIPPI